MQAVSNEKQPGNQIINCAAYSLGRRVADVELNDVHKVLKEENQFVWIALHEPSEETLARVQQEFGLHDLAVEDAHTAHQRPKIEIYGDSLFVVLRTAHVNQEHKIEFGETHFFVGDNFIVTVRHKFVSFLRRRQEYLRKLSKSFKQGTRIRLICSDGFHRGSVFSGRG